MKKVVIASKNPVKIRAVTQGFEKMFPGIAFEFLGTSVPSGVQNQPSSDNETFQGAFNRAANAARELPDAKYYLETIILALIPFKNENLY